MNGSNDVNKQERCLHGDKRCQCPDYQGYEILHIAFTIFPIIAGLDKFFNFLTNWSAYLSAPFNVLGNAHTTMLVVGVIEIIAGIGVWLKPKIFGYVVAIWLFFIIINLLVLGHFYDVALRDFGLLLGALALARLSITQEGRVIRERHANQEGRVTQERR